MSQETNKEDRDPLAPLNLLAMLTSVSLTPPRIFWVLLFLLPSGVLRVSKSHGPNSWVTEGKLGVGERASQDRRGPGSRSGSELRKGSQ